jgi:hypothetical protein
MCIILNRCTLIRLQRYNRGFFIKNLYIDIDIFAQFGHLSLIYLYNNNPNVICTTNAIDFAASNGHHDIVSWLHHNRTEGCTFWAMVLAAGGGYLNVVKFLNENTTCSEIDWASRNGHREIISFLKQHYPQFA